MKTADVPRLQIERLDPLIRRWWPEPGVCFAPDERRKAIERADNMHQNLGCGVRVIEVVEDRARTLYETEM